MDLTALRVRDARQLVARVDAADITNPDLPHLTAVDLLSRLKVTVDTLAGHAESQQAGIEQLRADKLRADDEVRMLRREAAARNDEALAAA
ncbi:hypothetical protein OG848_08305 [Streptomyces canus]|uniref:hypothetical protein n=1 Tax=Streptomyces canus TaxID=58343 RepID=UPI0032512B1A